MNGCGVNGQKTKANRANDWTVAIRLRPLLQEATGHDVRAEPPGCGAFLHKGFTDEEQADRQRQKT